MELPAELPRQEITIHPAHDLTDYIKIGEDVTEVLEITPPSFYVKRITYTKWMKKTLARVDSEPTTRFLSALAPSRTITGGIFGDSLLAYLVIGKYGPKMHDLIGRSDHLPLYRQIKIFERLGFHLAASTVSNAIAAVCRLLEPLVTVRPRPYWLACLTIIACLLKGKMVWTGRLPFY
jgi:transposase